MKINKNWAFLLPLIWFTTGVLYARTLEAFAGIGFIVMTIITSLGLFAGISTWRLTDKILYGILATIGFTVLIYLIIIAAVRL